MKKVILSVAVIVAIGLTSCKNDTKKDVDSATTIISKENTITNLSFGVRGNCGMCKNTIEKAANSIVGVTAANWDKVKKKIDVTFDTSKTNSRAIHNAIAASGYDTEKIEGSEEAYKGLPSCCQYDHGMIMNQSNDVVTGDHSNHNH